MRALTAILGLLALAAGGDHGGRAAGPVLRQWAAQAKASTEYGNPQWAAHQATGAPDTPAAGDHPTAWASRMEDAGDEWLELDYDSAVYPTLIRIRETYNPGAVSKVEAADAAGKWRVLWEGKDPNQECPGWCELKPAQRMATRRIRITIASAAVPGWNEIDAVELVGNRASQR